MLAKTSGRLLVSVAVCVLLVASLGSLLGCASAGSTTFGLPAYDPLSLITLRSDMFRTAEDYTVTFDGRDGYKATLTVSCEQAGEIVVAVPPYVSPVSKTFDSSPMIISAGSQEFAFLANDLPRLASAPGEGLAASLKQTLVAMQSELDHLEAIAAAGNNDAPLQHAMSTVAQQISAQQSLLDDLTANHQLILTDGTNQVTLSDDQLTQVDRILYAQYISMVQGPMTSIDLQNPYEASSNHPQDAARDSLRKAIQTLAVVDGPPRAVSVGSRRADEGGFGGTRNPDWDRVCQEVLEYMRTNGPDRLQLLSDSLWTGITNWSPLNLQLDEPITASAFAAAHTGVSMAWTAMAELTAGRGVSDPEDCQGLAEGISNMETAIKLMDISFNNSAYPQAFFYDDKEGYRSWKADNQAMLDTMRSWASRYCPDLGGTETSVDMGEGEGEGEGEGTTRWVLVDTSVNPNGEPTEFAGGGATEGWYTESRFEGKTLSIAATETSITLADRDVDHGFENYNITLTTSFEQPPSEMTPGDTVTLTVIASHTGTVTVGNPGLQFWYSSNDVSISPDTVLAYYPWAPEFDGTSTKTYSFTVPDTYDGGQLELSASWWNCPACLVIWRYEVRQDKQTPPTNEPPSYIWAPPSPA